MGAPVVQGPWASSTGRCARPGERVYDRDVPAADAEVLTDPIGRRITYLRLSILESCNLRCAYCRPASEAGVAALPPSMRRADIVRIARLFVSLGVKKVRLTGGEPTLHPDLVDIVREIRAFAPSPVVALTTNGVLLARLAPALRSAGLSNVNVSLDATTRESFLALTGRDRFEAVRAGIEAALAAGFAKVKINAVVLAGVNEDQIVPLALLARDLPVDVRFIEYMPIGGSYRKEAHVPAAEIERRVAEVLPLVPVEKEADAGPARMMTSEALRGRVGFIAPFSLRFCSDCNRVRVTSRGALRLCLLGGGEVDLLGAMRRGADDSELTALVRAGLAGKRERHPIASPLAAEPPCGAPMWAVGG
jgi:GTP 3',8-cyclase